MIQGHDRRTGERPGARVFRFGRLAAWLMLLAAVAGMAGLVHKGRLMFTDALLSESFESDSWEIGWRTFDVDSSGSGWRRLSAEEYYEAQSGDWSLGCRYNADGSPNDDWLISPLLRVDSTHQSFRLKYRSQDVDYLETVEFRVWNGGVDEAAELAAFLDDPATGELPRGELAAALEERFQLDQRVENIPVAWQDYVYEAGPDTTILWCFAARCVSADRFVLLVDNVQGLYSVPAGGFFIEPGFRRLDFGVHHADSSVTRSFRAWNLDQDSSMSYVFDIVAPPFYIEAAALDTQSVDPEDSLSILLWFIPYEADTINQDTLHQVGFFTDSLALHVFPRDGDTLHLSLPLSGVSWSADTLEMYLLAQDFEGPDDSTRWAGWTSQPDTCATSPLGWQLGEYVSSINFTVPATSRFAYINSDGQGQWNEGGDAIVQCDLLVSPFFSLLEVPGSGEDAASALLGYSLYYDGRNGGRIEILADSAGTGWRLLDEPEGTGYYWEERSLDVSGLAGADSLRLAFRFEGSWAYGVAVDDIHVVAGAQALPGAEIPPPPQVVRRDIVEIFPNPFNPVTQIRYTAREAGRLRYRVFNLLGQEVFASPPLLVRKGVNSFRLDMSSRAAGLYVVEFLLRPASAEPGEMRRSLRKITFLK